MYRVFISYAAENTRQFDALCGALRSCGLDPVQASKTITAGQDLARQILDEIRTSDEVCVVWTSNAKKSNWVRYECGMAFALGKRVVVLTGGSGQLPELYKAQQAMNLDNCEDYARQVSERASVRDLDSLLGPPQKPWQILSHCDAKKWKDAGAMPPANILEESLNRMAGFVVAKLEKLKKPKDADKDCELAPGEREAVQAMPPRKRVDVHASSVWLLDSPRSNTLVRELVQAYREWIVGGCIRIDQIGNGDEQIIIEDAGRTQNCASNKLSFPDPGKGQIGNYIDYIVLMRLPGGTLGLANTKARVWIIFGLHARGTFVAARLIDRENLKHVMRDLHATIGHSDQPGHSRPRPPLDFFEIVYTVPADISIHQVDHKHLKVAHAKELRSRSQDATSDEPDWGILPLFTTTAKRRELPVQVVHLDLVAGCNFRCPRCIEMGMRDNRMRLSFRTSLRVLNELRNHGCRKVGFYGGEPTLHPDFAAILDTAGNMGFEITLVTNGSKLGELPISKAIERQRGRIQVRVSLDADTEATHKRVHGRRDNEPTFDRIVKSCESLISTGVHLSISYLLLSGINVKELPGACQRWQRSHARQLAIRVATGVGGKERDELTSEEADVVRNIREQYGSFLSYPTWLCNNATRDRGRVIECYSAYYRIAVSPACERQSAKSPKNSDLCVSAEDFTETDKAWISLCTYNRHKEGFGEEFPEDFGQWIRSTRHERISALPMTECDGVNCCRSTYNRVVQHYLNLGEN